MSDKSFFPRERLNNATNLNRAFKQKSKTFKSSESIYYYKKTKYLPPSPGPRPPNELCNKIKLEKSKFTSNKL